LSLNIFLNIKIRGCVVLMFVFLPLICAYIEPAVLNQVRYEYTKHRDINTYENPNARIYIYPSMYSINIYNITLGDIELLYKICQEVKNEECFLRVAEIIPISTQGPQENYNRIADICINDMNGTKKEMIYSGNCVGKTPGLPCKQEGYRAIRVNCFGRLALNNLEWTRSLCATLQGSAREHCGQAVRIEDSHVHSTSDESQDGSENKVLIIWICIVILSIFFYSLFSFIESDDKRNSQEATPPNDHRDNDIINKDPGGREL